MTTASEYFELNRDLHYVAMQDYTRTRYLPSLCNAALYGLLGVQATLDTALLPSGNMDAECVTDQGEIRAILDIETNGLLDEPNKRVLALKIFVLHRDGDKIFETPVSLHWISDMVDSGYIVHLYGHNITGFDVPFLLESQDLYPYDLEFAFRAALEGRPSGIRLTDTLILSRLVNSANPDTGFQRNSHSLDSYAEELGFIKMKFPFELTQGEGTLSLPATSSKMLLDAMATYCESDCLANFLVLQHLIKKAGSIMALGGEVSKPLLQETAVQRAVDQQDPFKLIPKQVNEYLEKLAEFYKEEERHWLSLEVKLPGKDVFPPKKQFKVDGTPTKAALTFFGNVQKRSGKYYGISPDGTLVKLPFLHPIQTVQDVPINSPTKIRKWLEVNHNVLIPPGEKLAQIRDDGHIEYHEKITNLTSLHGVVFQALECHARAMKIQHTLSLVLGLREASYDDGLLKAPAIACGTRTHRFKHRVVANLSNRSPLPWTGFTPSVKTLLHPPQGVMVGWDIQGLETVIEAHYCYPYSRDYANELLTGDVHTPNAQRWGVLRDKAKEVKYALMYGVGIQKLSEILDCSVSVAATIRDDFWRNADPLSSVREELQIQFNKTGYVTALDGRLLVPSGQHTALNTCFQGSGAIVAKRAALIMLESTQHDRGEDVCGPLVRYHDEEQWWAHPDWANDVGRLGVRSVQTAGAELNLNVPITAEYRIGATWADTH